MAPTTQGFCSLFKTTAGDIAPPNSLVHWEYDVGGEGGGGNKGEVMVQKKVSTWGLTGNSILCPLKPMQWLQRTDTFPYT
eukprot:14264697-Ditylum_brightwellii.AAC.1